MAFCTYTVVAPALPGCIAQGQTAEEAVELARQAIRIHITSMEAHGEPVPEETDEAQVLKVEVAQAYVNAQDVGSSDPAAGLGVSGRTGSTEPRRSWLRPLCCASQASGP